MQNPVFVCVLGCGAGGLLILKWIYIYSSHRADKRNGSRFETALWEAFLWPNRNRLRKKTFAALAFSAVFHYNKMIFYSYFLKRFCRVSKIIGSSGL
jgi:hypothetical protein